MRILLPLLIFAALTGQSAAETSPLRVGFIGGFSGPGEVYGRPCRNGFELGWAAAKDHRLKVIYEDDQFIPAKTIAAFRKLTEMDRVDVLIVLGSIPSSAVAPLSEQRPVPTFAWTGDPGVSRGRRWIIRTWTSAVSEGARLAGEAAARGYERIALVSSTDNYSRAVVDGLKAGYPGKIALAEEFAADNMDFRTTLSRLRSGAVAQAGICLAAGQSAALAKQSRELGLKLEIFGCETLNNAQEVRLAKGALRGAWYTTIPVEDWFRREYRRRYGSQDTLGGAAVHFDLAGILSRLGARGVRGKEVLQEALKVKHGGGAVGELAVVESDGEQRFDLPVVVQVIQ